MLWRSNRAIIPAEAPIAWLSTEWGYGKYEDRLLIGQINNRELEFLGKDPTGSIDVWGPQFRRFGCTLGRSLHCFVEAFAKHGTDCRVVAYFVDQFEARLVMEANGSHF